MQFSVYIIFMLASFVAGITVYFKKPAPLYLKLLPIFLLFTISLEFLSSWLAQHTGNNLMVYNIYNIINFCFMLFVIREVIANKLMKWITSAIIIFYACFAIVNMVYIQKTYLWNSISFSLGSLMVVALSIYYFLELFKRPKSINLIKEPAFWICSGLLFFYSCSFPLLGLNNFMQNAPVVLRMNLGNILMLLNILLYSLFTIAFICRLDIRKIF